MLLFLLGRGKGLRLRSLVLDIVRPANIDNNFTEKIEKIKKILGSWSARRLLMGKIAILKSLAVSLVYVLSSFPTPKGVIKELRFII